MQGPSHQFLAGTRRTSNENVCPLSRQEKQLLAQGPDRRPLPHQTIIVGLAEAMPAAMLPSRAQRDLQGSGGNQEQHLLSKLDHVAGLEPNSTHRAPTDEHGALAQVFQLKRVGGMHLNPRLVSGKPGRAGRAGGLDSARTLSHKLETLQAISGSGAATPQDHRGLGNGKRDLAHPLRLLPGPEQDQHDHRVAPFTGAERGGCSGQRGLVMHGVQRPLRLGLRAAWSPPMISRSSSAASPGRPQGPPEELPPSEILVPAEIASPFFFGCR